MTQPQPPARLIMIDDQPLMAKLVRQMLPSYEYDLVATGRDGIEGPALIAENRPDALICDINMPKVNGLSLLKAIRCGRAGYRHDLPVLLLSGFSQGVVFKAAMALDVNAFLVKPVNAANLIDRLKRVLSNPRPVKDPDAYLRVAVPQLDEDGEPMVAQPKTNAAALRQPPPGSKLLRLSALEPGMTLAAPVMGCDGSIVIDAGELVTQEMIERLGDMKELGVVADAAAVMA